MLSDQLKEKTKTAHQQLEKLLIRKIKCIDTADDYVKILISFYQFWTPLEGLINSHIDGHVNDISKRRKAGWIMEDLKFLGASQPRMLPSPYLPTVGNSSQALGVLYVMEGSTLGGQIICKMIAQKLQVSTDEGFAFFSGYGEETAEMWDSFKAHLDGQSFAPEVEKEIIEAANYTFQLFERSLRAKLATEVRR